MKRVLTAAALIPIVCYVVLWADYRVFLAVLAASACLTWRECRTITLGGGGGDLSWQSLLSQAAGLLLLLTAYGNWWLIVLPLTAAFVLFKQAARLAQMPRLVVLTLGVFYIFGAWWCAIPLRAESPHWLMYALLVSWTGDIGAYYIGRRFGRHRLAERISPKKSWEGAAASVATALLLAGAYLVYFVGVPIVRAAVLTAVANVAGQLGDLVESGIKRGAGVKDSGSILPGHGGFFDRVDSTLFTLPVVYLYLKLLAAS
ncbi:MAG TPA: phosphatidate cytidylyltransferase [Bryobacteraceae bacterium]|nr:phosphatidate cytidylyltransferase [Bryobacteraceae bacterium]